MNTHRSTIILLALAAGLFFGIVELFELRFNAGDVYPAYSSLRADPLGTMALYESIGRVPGFSVRRDFSASNHLPHGKDRTYFHIASSIPALQQMPEESVREIERFVTSGGRFVITLSPQQAEVLPADSADRFAVVQKRWGLSFRTIELPHSDDKTHDPVLVESDGLNELPDILIWHSPAVVANADSTWTPIYKREDDGVVVERRFGSGSVVISTDSYFLSNEAMQEDRLPDLLVWLIGSGKEVIFDEAHLGVTENPGVAGLLRKYGLQWFIGTALLLAVLFVWKNSTSLVPYRAHRDDQEYLMGKDSAAGLDNLLRRNITGEQILTTCFNEWKKLAMQLNRYPALRVQMAEEVFAAAAANGETRRDPVNTYRNISRTLHACNK